MKTNILRSILFLIRAVNGKMRKNTVEADRPQMINIKLRMLNAFWVTKATLQTQTHNM